MKVNLREIHGPWDAGWVLDKHMDHSTYLGDLNGRPQFDNVRTEAGEATFQLKYRFAWDQAPALAQALADNIYPKLASVGFIVPMPASKKRDRQPVAEVAQALGKLVGTPVFDELLNKAPNGQPLKDLPDKASKLAAIGDGFSVRDDLEGDGPWNVLVIDDLYQTGASMEAACKVLRTYPKVRRIYMAALTWS
ncbi:hypothetical protein GmRootV59_16040 [Variovorax sp. V59]|uniref:ComF family protein n=1 Tax=unclassified Variovorax TaxID=663243 RepID=UPI0034E8ABCC